jgi:hypothetical protein
MKLLRASVVAVALSAVSIGIGYAQFGVARGTDNEPAAACARCGDGQCQKSCGENEKTCPRDCGGVPQESSR